MKERKQLDNTREELQKKSGQERDASGNSSIQSTNRQANDPASDRVAKSTRKGAGQQQSSSGGPVNS